MCEHENFDAKVDINRLEDTKAFLAELSIQCRDCGEHFVFPNLPVGLSCSEVRVSWDEESLRVPIKPASQVAFNAFPGFSVREAEN